MFRGDSTMSTLRILTFSLFIALASVPLACSADPPEISPITAPELGADVASPPSNSSPGASPSSSPSPAPSDSLNSPPAPPPSDLAPDSSPAPAPSNGTLPEEKSPSPAPAPGVASDISHAADADNIEASESSGGMKPGQKAGIAIGVIAGVFVVGIGALVYKKRQQNIRRSEFGYAVRRDLL